MRIFADSSRPNSKRGWFYRRLGKQLKRVFDSVNENSVFKTETSLFFETFEVRLGIIRINVTDQFSRKLLEFSTKNCFVIYSEFSLKVKIV